MLNDRRTSETDGGLADYTSNGKKNSCSGCRGRNRNQSPRGRTAVASPVGLGIRQMTENRLELLTKKEAAQLRLSLHL